MNSVFVIIYLFLYTIIFVLYEWDDLINQQIIF